MRDPEIGGRGGSNGCFHPDSVPILIVDGSNSKRIKIGINGGGVN